MAMKQYINENVDSMEDVDPAWVSEPRVCKGDVRCVVSTKIKWDRWEKSITCDSRQYYSTDITFSCQALLLRF